MGTRGCHYFPPGLRLPSQSQDITAILSVSKRTVRCDGGTCALAAFRGPHSAARHEIRTLDLLNTSRGIRPMREEQSADTLWKFKGGDKILKNH